MSVLLMVMMCVWAAEQQRLFSAQANAGDVRPPIGPKDGVDVMHSARSSLGKPLLREKKRNHLGNLQASLLERGVSVDSLEVIQELDRPFTVDRTRMVLRLRGSYEMIKTSLNDMAERTPAVIWNRLTLQQSRTSGEIEGQLELLILHAPARSNAQTNQ